MIRHLHQVLLRQRQPLKVGPSVTGFEKVDEVSEETMAGGGKVSTRWGGGKESGEEEASPFW
jgi:hypothetical protein